MKHFKRIIILLSVLFFALGTLALPTDSALAGKPQTKCPVLGNPINKDIYTDYQGKRIYFCCASCPQEFKKDPAKYMKKMEEEGVTPEAAPKK
jgi:YHS domain-containing protein